MIMNKEDFIKMYKNTKKEEIIEELFYKCTANYRLNNIVNELEAMFDGDLDGFFTINEKGSCNEIIEVIQNYKNKLKELKEGK